MKYLEACTQKFALYLYQNGFLNESFIIKRSDAKQIYDKFRKNYKAELNFNKVMKCSKRFLRHLESGKFVQYDKAKLDKQLQNLAEIDSAFYAITSTKKKNDKKIKNQQNTEDVVENICKLCVLKFNNKEELDKHFIDKEHIFYQDFYKACRIARFQQNPIITINNSTSLSNIIVRKNVPTTFNLQIRTSSHKPLTILAVDINSEIEGIKLNALTPCKFSSSTVITWKLDVHCKNEGVLVFPILLKTEKTNEILRHPIELVFHIHNEFFDDLHPVQPFETFSKSTNKNVIEDLENPEPLHNRKSTKDVVPLHKYRLPDDTLKILNSNLQPFDGMSKNQKKELDYIKDLTEGENIQNPLAVRQNYARLLKILLFMEEHQMLKNMKTYDKTDQQLKRVGNLVELQVQDLAERRPSLMVSDTVRLKDTIDSKTPYDGIVKVIKENSVLLKFPMRVINSLFKGNKKFHVSFIFNRFTLQAQHQAIEFAKIDNITHFFFPKHIPRMNQNEPELTWFNTDIANNPQQQQAVRAILKKSAMPAPYLIFGPPGTGKTMTVVECIKQIFQRTNEKVLICTPSNNAANELMRRLIDTITPRDLFRFIAISFSEQMPEELKLYSNFRKNIYYQPTTQDLVKYRIVITTLISASKLINRGCPPNHFSYIFIDEAGQATESETLIPIARILTNPLQPGQIFGQIVLAGDPKQLGPVIQSPLAKKFGFGTSMLERLMDTCPQYQKNKNGVYNPSALTKLLKNYRSHSVIINQPNLLFYENELEVCGDDLINIALNWSGLPNRDFPMIFHSVIGEDQREKNSPSFFNIQEIQIVLEYLDKLIGCRMQGITISQDQILVISPYRKQVEKIKQACNKKGFNNLFVGSVEQVQGQERLIVIISTVRSKVQLLNFDSKFHLGFLNNPKRFNVAITRAKALLVIIGNPNVLQYDNYWKSLIQYCKNNGAILGNKFDLNENLSDTQNMSQMDESDSGEGTSFSGASN